MRISTKTISFMAGSLFMVGLAAGTNVGCGSSSSDNVSICNQSCDKQVSCLGDAAASFGLSKSVCMTQCMQASNTTSCPNASTIAADVQACLKETDCTAFQACIRTAPQCTASATGGTSGTLTGGSSGTGTGGAGGHATGATGGTTGAAGNGGTADCSACAKASACCSAEAAFGGSSAASCSMFSVAKCNAGDTTSTAANCQAIVQTGALLSLPACQ